jgi:hypothetical protein
MISSEEHDDPSNKNSDYKTQDMGMMLCVQEIVSKSL